VAEEVQLLGPAGALGSSAGLAVIENRLYFTTFDQTGTPLALYQMSSAAAPPALVSAEFDGAASVCPIFLRNLLYLAQVSSGRVTLVGTASGTTRAFSNLTVSDSWCRQQVVVGATLYFPASQTDSGRELWRYDEGAATPQLVGDLAPGPTSSAPSGLLPLGDQLIFEARVDGEALWRLEAGADAVPELILAGSVDQLLPSVNRLYLAGRSGTASMLYRFDPLDGRLDLLPFPTGGSQQIVAMFFFASRLNVVTLDGEQRATLWQLSSDEDRLIATGALADLSFSIANQFTAVGERFFFAGSLGTSATQIWIGTGTPGNTLALDDITSVNDDNPVFLTAVEDALFYVAADAQGERAVFRTDGTGSGTWAVALDG
jgi:ELWxxDGT repeat protein